MSAPSLKANEPSMEEILASIRRIISDDQDKKPEPVAPPPPPAPEPAVSEPEDVLDLATVPTGSSALGDVDIEFREVDGLEPLPEFDEPEPEPVVPPPPPA